MKQLTWACVCALGMALAGCGGGAEANEDDGPPDGQETAGGDQAAAAEAPVAWADMSHEQRGAFMAETVMPEMQAMFQEFDGERFAEFNCATCHGENAREVNFEMPNGVAPLDPAQIPGMFQSDQPMAQFMTQRVWPRMAELLQEPPYNPETHEGFSCLHCHATAEGAGG